MAKLFCRDSKFAVRATLCIVIGCLGVHFLLEDAFLPASTAGSPSQSGWVQTANLGGDEATHQDDLVLPVSLPVNRVQLDAPAAQMSIVPVEKVVGAPIHIPPKIA